MQSTMSDHGWKYLHSPPKSVAAEYLHEMDLDVFIRHGTDVCIKSRTFGLGSII
jgi:hypothetical protein